MKRRFPRLIRQISFTVLFWVSTINPVFSQLYINEFGASNSTTAVDPDFKDYSDWIEIYNAGYSTINLDGYYITDNLGDPAKWKLSGSILVEAGGFVLIWADDRATGIHTGFKLSADGEEIGLFSRDLVLIDSISFGLQKTDVSYGRKQDGSSEWGFFLRPTPGQSNTSTSYSGVCYNLPDFSIRGGMYQSALSLELKTDIDGVIRYTEDGSEPTAASLLYSSPITIDQTTVVRAKIFADGMIPGPAVTHSYFIDENSVGGKLPVISLASDPGNFWDPDSGLYVQDFKPEWEIPVNIELFENNGSDRAAFNLMAGTKVNGLNSWVLPQKMLGIYFRNGYGEGSLDYPVTDQRPRRNYKSFALRASGSDWSYSLFRDILGQDLTRESMDIDIMGFKPSVVYINGRYMGIHNIREKVDDDYIEKSYQLEPGTFDLIENGYTIESGDLQQYNELKSRLLLDLGVPANYDQVAEIIDIENFTDYMITEMAVRNTSIHHNVMTWKPKASGKWRWVLMDLDRGFFRPSGYLLDYYVEADVLPLGKLFQNPEYRFYFAQRLSAHLLTTFNPVRVRQKADEHAADIESEVPRHVERWDGATSSYGNAIPSFDFWKEQVCEIKLFADERPAFLLSSLESYGFGKAVGLGLTTDIIGAGILRINHIEVPGGDCFGLYPANLMLRAEVEERPGYGFLGWKELSEISLIASGDEWKYYDLGSEAGSGWKDPGFDDSTWKTGASQLGYGDGDENTVVEFGSNSSSKYLTTYFRKKFTVEPGSIDIQRYVIDLLRDDGAVVYLNGEEIIRSNMECGIVDYHTEAFSAASNEDEFISFYIDRDLFREGENILAVEVHQNDPGSSDLSFDLEMKAYKPVGTSYFSTARQINLTIQERKFFSATFNQVSSCILPAVIEEEMVLGTDCSPWLVNSDIIIGKNAKLTIEPGVEIWMTDGANIFVEGQIKAMGTADSGIVIKLNPETGGTAWGGICFMDTDTVSELAWLSIEGASHGPDPVNQYAAISAFHADLEMDHLSLLSNKANPVIARYSDIRMTNSDLYSPVTGDLINVKYGTAYISGCNFTGNDQPDTDAIDYDEIQNGIIRNCRIYGFFGYNSDAVDIGENAVNVLIDSLYVNSITDKGVSVGQRSTVTITNSIFTSCDMGVAVKDSSRVLVDRCIFYGNAIGIAGYEKNAGHAGGNVIVRNTVLSNSSGSAWLKDDKSTMNIVYSLSDNDFLPADGSNINANPLFTSPGYYDFSYLSGSPAIDAGMDNGLSIDIGTGFTPAAYNPSVLISGFYIDPVTGDFPEFIILLNPSEETIDISGYSVTRGVSLTIPEGTLLDPGEEVILTLDEYANSWWQQSIPVIQWESGKLSNGGEAVQLEENHGIVVDFVEYENDGSWPVEGFVLEKYFKLKNPGLDNHLGENWTAASLAEVVDTAELIKGSKLSVYPNPTAGPVTVKGLDYDNERMDVYNSSGQIIGSHYLDGKGLLHTDLSVYGSNILFIRVGEQFRKVIILKK